MKKQLDIFLKAILLKVLSGVQEDPEDKENVDPVNKSVYCFRRRGEFGKMVMCDGLYCKYVWFHFNCVHLTTEPK